MSEVTIAAPAAAAPVAAAPTGTILGTATPPAAAPAAASWNWAAEDGKFSEDWQNKLPEDIKGHASLKAIGTVQDLAKSYVHTKGMIGQKREFPGEGATPEAIAEWRKLVGAPEKPEGYLGDAKTLRPDSVPEGLWDTKAEQDFLAIAHKHHLPPAAVKEILNYHGQHVQNAVTQSQEQEQAIISQEVGKLKTAWGNEFDQNVNIARRMALTLGMKVDKVENGKLVEAGDPIFSNAHVVQAFAKMASLISEDKLVTGDKSMALGGSIQERIRDITDPKSASQLSRAYRGELGSQAQTEAQTTLHGLYAASQQK